MVSFGWICLFMVLGTADPTLASISLEILPKSRPIRKEVGENLVLTCRPAVSDKNIISNLEWRDKNNRRIDNSHRSNLKIQYLHGDVGILLVFTGITAQQAGSYSCHANYANTEPLSESVEVQTYVDVKFVDAKENQYPIAGTNSKIKCVVKGDPAPMIDWYKGDTLLQETSSKYIREPDGLQIQNVTEGDDGIYKCSALVVSTGNYKTRNIKVEVQVPPTIIPMNPVQVVEGETASVLCKATGKPPPSYRWIKVDKRNDLSKTDRFDVKNTTGELIMNRVEFGDDGLYKCEAENSAGRVETQVKVNVLVKPQIYELLNATAPTGSEAKLVCKVKGRPAPEVTFRKLSHEMAFQHGINSERVNVEQKSFQDLGESIATLTITNLNRSDDGLYECIAKNPTGKAYKNGHITVHFKPTFNRTKDLPSVWSWDGRPGNLSCLPEAIPNATIVWRWNQIEINEENFNKNLINRNNFQVIGRSPQSFLIVKPYNQPRLYSEYECLARNALGEASTKIQLRKGFVPGPIREARRNLVTATTVKFNIIPPSNYDGPPLRSYTVQYKPEMVLDWDSGVTHTWSVGAPYIIENLIPETTYQFRFAARNDVGLSSWTNVPIITMPRRSEPAEPAILLPTGLENIAGEIGGQYSNHFELRWNVPADNGEPIEYYLVRYCRIEQINGEDREQDCSEPQQQSVQYTNYHLNQLLPDTLYKVELRAHNAIGDSSPAILKFRTARGIGPAPQTSTNMSSALIIGIVVAAILIILILVDMACFLINRTGLIALCCEKTRQKKKDEEDPKLGSYKAAPAHPNTLNLPQPVKLAATSPDASEEEKEPLNQPQEKPISVEFDGRQVYTKSGEIIGKHSAV